MNKEKLKSLIEQSNYRIKKYKEKILEVEKSFRELNSLNMQAVLIQFEDYLDNNNLYAFDNWLEGIIWDGPNVKRYWVDVTLEYPYDKMPDPLGAMRLVNTGAKISYKKSTEIISVPVRNANDLDPVTRKPKEKKIDVWLVKILVPRRFIDNSVEEYSELEPEKNDSIEQENKINIDINGTDDTGGLVSPDEGGEESLEV